MGMAIVFEITGSIALNIIILGVIAIFIVGLIKIAFKLFLVGIAVAAVVTTIYLIYKLVEIIMTVLGPYILYFLNLVSSVLK